MNEKFIVKPEEALVVRKAMDSAFLCMRKETPVYTDFYNPKNVSYIIRALKSMVGINITQFGGADLCERVILCISPDYYMEECCYPIKAIFIDSSKFSSKLTHRDFLGALIGMGIDRGKIGDIVVDKGNAKAYVHSNIADFIVNNLTKVGNVGVSASYCQDLEILALPGKTIKATVASMRADAVVGEAFGISRNMAKELINSEKLFVNWSQVSNTSDILKEGDVISLRGFGRAIIHDAGRRTKKNRIFLEMERWL